MSSFNEVSLGGLQFTTIIYLRFLCNVDGSVLRRHALQTCHRQFWISRTLKRADSMVYQAIFIDLVGLLGTNGIQFAWVLL